jgi:DNA-binding NtrC family response regulator
MTKRILFVDDDVPLRVTLSMYFKMKGIQVTAAENCHDALRLAEQGQFSAAIVDINMGDEDGMDLLDTLTLKYPALPVIMFSSLGDTPELRNTSLRRGAKGHFSKSEPIDTLYQGVRTIAGL